MTTIKFEPDQIEILQNFKNFSNIILIYPEGFKFKNDDKSCVGYHFFEKPLPMDNVIRISDGKEFLNYFRVLDDPVIQIKQNSNNLDIEGKPIIQLILTDDKTKIKYNTSPKIDDNYEVSDKVISSFEQLNNECLSFLLTSKDYSKLIKLANTIYVDSIVFTFHTENGKLCITIDDVDHDEHKQIKYFVNESNVYKQSDKKFSIPGKHILSFLNDGNYIFNFKTNNDSTNGIVKVHNNIYNIFYYVGCKEE